MRSPHAPALALFLSFTTSAAFAQFTPGRLAVLEFGYTGSIPQEGGPLVIREFAPDGTPGVVMNVPSTGPSAMVNCHSFVLGASLALTPSGDKLIFSGFTSTAPTGTSLISTSAAAIPRAIGTVDINGVFERPWTTSTYFNSGTIYATATDGVNYWAAGSNNGICYLGPGTPTVINTEVSAQNALSFHSLGLLAAAHNIYRVGSGIPTAPAALEPLFGAPGVMDLQMSPDGTVCYTAHIGSVKKWVLSGSTWTNVYSFNAPGWLVRIAVDFAAPQPVIYGVHNIPSKLEKWVDAGAPSAPILLATMSGNGNWYGLSFTPGTFCSTVGQPCDDSDPTTVNDHVRPDCACRGDQVHVAAKVFLEGPFIPVAGTMLDALRTLATFPQTEPYTALGLAPTSGSGATIGAGVLSVTGNNAIVDWVLLELRDVVDPATVLHRMPSLLQRDGDVVALDGVNALSLPAAPGMYRIAVRHRNHLSAMTLNAIALGDVAVLVDFTLATTATYGTNALKTVGSVQVLWAGDVNCNGQVKYAGGANDRDPILSAIGGSVPTATVNGQYRQEDLNMNSQVRYAGGSNDRDLILQNIGGSVPTAVRNAQLP
ncbi:MAG: hypothetical protein IPH53_03365 [Flavobacteriales bacterium]|jgi:hypothetical protein|nr:hypothetical protein [Flavobacteriales bacterium]MBK9076988.1 hypothetical protein [Flavobacteriales bacterium]